MSYEIVKKIKIEDDKVFITCHSSNVYPKIDDTFRSNYFEKILKEKGREELEIDILRSYESGSFQGKSVAKYNRALQVLRHFPEYKKFDWRSGATYEQRQNSEEFKELLKRALKTSLPKDKFVITKKSYNGATLYGKKTTRAMHWVATPQKATKYHWKEDAEEVKKWFYGSDDWEIIKIN